MRLMSNWEMDEPFSLQNNEQTSAISWGGGWTPTRIHLMGIHPWFRSNNGGVARCWSFTAKYAGPNSLGFSVRRARSWLSGGVTLRVMASYMTLMLKKTMVKKIEERDKLNMTKRNCQLQDFFGVSINRWLFRKGYPSFEDLHAHFCHVFCLCCWVQAAIHAVFRLQGRLGDGFSWKFHLGAEDNPSLLKVMWGPGEVLQKSMKSWVHPGKL